MVVEEGKTEEEDSVFEAVVEAIEEVADVLLPLFELPFLPPYSRRAFFEESESQLADEEVWFAEEALPLTLLPMLLLEFVLFELLVTEVLAAIVEDVEEFAPESVLN